MQQAVPNRARSTDEREPRFVLSSGRAGRWNLAQLSRILSFILGGFVLCLASLKAIAGIDVQGAFAWLNTLFGPVFIIAYLLLVGVAVIAWVKGHSANSVATVDPWWEAGVQAASGIATLALTFTLLGISIGISALAETPLSPETVPEVISHLTEQFGRAFMTTIVGLPTSHVLRALLSIQASARRRQFEMAAKHTVEL